MFSVYFACVTIERIERKIFDIQTRKLQAILNEIDWEVIWKLEATKMFLNERI